MRGLTFSEGSLLCLTTKHDHSFTDISYIGGNNDVTTHWTTFGRGPPAPERF